MTASANFATYAVELLGAAGRVTARRMFGGYGLYCDGVMFALIADDVLYLKADDVNRPELERVGSAPFTYEARGRRTIIAYWRAPDEAMESRDLMARGRGARSPPRCGRRLRAPRRAPRLKAKPKRRDSRAGSKR